MNLRILIHGSPMEKDYSQYYKTNFNNTFFCLGNPEKKHFQYSTKNKVQIIMIFFKRKRVKTQTKFMLHAELIIDKSLTVLSKSTLWGKLLHKTSD